MPQKHDSRRKHNGFSKGSGQVIIMAAVAAARTRVKEQGTSSQLPDLGVLDPWLSGGEDDVRKGKEVRPKIQHLLKSHKNLDLEL